MLGYSSDEEDAHIEESDFENERNADLNALRDHRILDDEQYNNVYFDDLDLKRFRDMMIPGSYSFVDIAVAHIEGTLTAKGDKIASGLVPQEINEVMRDLSEKWMNLDFLATNIFPGDEAMKRNSVNLLHHDWFAKHFELTDAGRYRIQETDENREVLEMMKEGARYACRKKQDDDNNRNKENERPENRARFMHGCNFLTSVIKITCDKECLDKVEWHQVQTVYSEMFTLFENKSLHSGRNYDGDQQKLELFEVYRKVLKLDEHKRLNGDSMKYITGRRKAKDALCEPLFANIGMHTTDDSGSFTVYILDFNKEYSKEDIDKVLKSNDRPMTRDEKQRSKKEEDLLKKEQERNERKSTYTPKFTSRVNGVIPELPSRPKSTTYGKTGWDGANDDVEDDDPVPSTSGLAPQLAKVINRKSERENPTKAVNPEPQDDPLISDEDAFSSAGEMDGNKDNLYSDDEGDRVRRKKKVLKKSEVCEPKEDSLSKESGSARQNNQFPTSAKHKPFNSNEEDDDDSELEEEQDESENIIIEEEPIVMNNSTSVTEDTFDGSNFESHQHVTGDLDMLIDRNLPDQLYAGSLSSKSIILPRVTRDADHRKDVETHVARLIQKKHDQEKLMKEEGERLRRALQIRKQKEEEFVDDERIRRLAQEKSDEVYARELQNTLDSISVHDERIPVEINKVPHQNGRVYEGNADVGGHRRVPSNDHQSQPLDSSQLWQDRINERSRPESLSSNRYMVGPQATNQLRDNGRNTMLAIGAQPLACSSYTSASQNFGRSSRHCDSPYDNGKLSLPGCPGFLCNVPTNIMTTLSDKANEDNNFPVGVDILQDFHSYPVDLEYHRSSSYDQSAYYHLADSGFKSGEYSNSGPQATHGIGSFVNSRIVLDIPPTRGPAFRTEYDNGAGVLRDEMEMNRSLGSHGYARMNRERPEDYRGERYSNLAPPRTEVRGSYNAFPLNRNDVSRRGTSHSYSRSNVDRHGIIPNQDLAYPSQRSSNSLNPQGDAFVKFLEFYMIMFGRPAVEIQWSEIVERCKKIDTTFRYQHPSNIFGTSFVDQLLQRLPDYIQVFSLEGSSEVIFAIDECRYRGFSSLGDLRIVFIEFVHSFLPAFNCAIKWNHIVENNILFPCLDSVFGTPLGGNWMEEFTELAHRMGLPLKAQKPCSQIYLHILQC